MAFNYTSLQTPVLTADTTSNTTVSRGIGILLPFRKVNGGIFQVSRETNSQLRANVINFIKTKKQERLYHPTFGLSIYDFLFEQMSDRQELSSRIKKSIRDDFSFWLPYVSISYLDVTFPEEYAIQINMGVGFIPTQANYNVVIFINNASSVNVEII
jgi:hypothetical protein